MIRPIFGSEKKKKKKEKEKQIMQSKLVICPQAKCYPYFCFLGHLAAVFDN